MKLEIIVAKGKQQGQRLSVDRPGIYRLGRKAGSDLTLAEDRHVSRHHCQIELTAAGVCRIVDTSRGGTFVNGKRVQKAQLVDGDKLRLGQTVLSVSLIEGAPRIPGFTLEEPLAGVGPGEHWSATSDLLDQLVVLHFLSLDPAGEAVEKAQQQRFLREAAICARTYHPGLLSFLDQNIAGNFLWFATELAEGQNLQQRVEQRGPLPVTEAIEVISQVLDIVAYLHQKSIVHRGLRPLSLQVQTEADKFTVRLTDLGSAKCFQPLELQPIAGAGERSFPFPIHPFIAPEVLHDFKALDPRSDLYAIGAIFYFALTGRPPYEVLAEQDLVRTILAEKPPALSSLKPDLPPAIVAVVEQAMAPEPEQRYNTAPEMLDALRRTVDMLQPPASLRVVLPGKRPVVGKLIDHYEIMAELGRGRMGTVYRARDTRTGREVALKLLRLLDQPSPAPKETGGLSASQRRQRFEREVKLASRLNHPHIVTVYDVNLAHEPLYLVMELLEGGSLEERLRQEERLVEWLQQGKTLEAWLEKQMPWPEVLTLLRPLVQALAYTHQTGAVHRDVKPANIMFTAPEGILKLVDFGLAHWAVGTTLTKTSDILGAPAYLSPEQARGKPVDGRSDIFALGLILFEAITGVNPLDKGPLFQTIIELGSDRPLDTRLLYHLKIPQPVIDLIERAIAKNPAERPPTCEAFLAHLDECLETTATEVTVPRPAWRPWDGRPPARPVIHQENQLDLNDQEKALLQTLFSTHNRIVIETQFRKGFSNSRVLQVRPVDESGVRRYLPAVVKIGPRWLIEQEWRAYQAWVEKILPGIARLEGNPILGERQGILRYALVGSGIFPVQSLRDYYQQHDANTIRRLLVDRLFKVLGRQWWKAYRSDFSFHLQVDYDSLLPVNLLLESVDAPPSAAFHLIEPNRLPLSAIQVGDYVKIKGFVVTEVELSPQRLTLDLPPTAKGPASSIAQVSFGYRLRLTGVPNIEQYRTGQPIDVLSGQVIATRQDILLEQAIKILPKTLNLAAESLPVSANWSLPNPLLAYQDILRQTRPAHRATIHGDLNLENILIDPETSELSLIDFATVRRGHSLHDLLRLETEVVTKLLPATLRQAELPLHTIPTLYHRLHQTTATPDATVVSIPLHPALDKPFTIIGAIRQAAREHLFDRTDWTEYYQGLTLYLLGTLKFKNLDEMPESPLPKQVAFWGAATAVELL